MDQFLASLAPFLPDADASVVRRHIIERLFSLRDENRAESLKLLGHPAVFAWPTVPDVLRARLMNDIEERCWRWSWRQRSTDSSPPRSVEVAVRIA